MRSSMSVIHRQYSKPKIALIDLPESAVNKLAESGYNVTKGSFGTPFEVIRSNASTPILLDCHLPNYPEQEIIFVDLSIQFRTDKPEIPQHELIGANSWYELANTGVVDPRPLAMIQYREHSERILESGGIFVVFAASKWTRQYTLGELNPFTKIIKAERKTNASTWSILSIFEKDDHVEIKSDSGTEYTVDNSIDCFCGFFQNYLSDGHFEATFQQRYYLSNSKSEVFIPLVLNKYQGIVSFVIWPKTSGRGFVIVLPQIKDKSAAIFELVQTVLPEISPRMFPNHEGGKWVQRKEYEHFKILKMMSDQREAQRKATEEIARLEQEIESERDKLAFLHTLLTGTGDELVVAVKKTLEYIGFVTVIDIDETEKEQQNKQEDLQILDSSPSLLLEIKGLSGFPREGNTIQVTKFVLRRIKGWNRTDVTGISLINHQRNIPALERNHVTAFTTQQVDDAKENGTGLMTTWTLFKLVRGMISWGWPTKAIRECFYGKGLLSQVPSHYSPIGTVAHFYTDKSVLSVELSAGELRIGERIGFLFDDVFYEEQVTSLQVERKPVNVVLPPQKAGIVTQLKRNEVPVGMVVYKVNDVEK
jgi:hypothetical protein